MGNENLKQKSLELSRAWGRLGGRPSVMSREKLDLAYRLLAEGNTLGEVAEMIGVSRSTLIRHLKKDRKKLLGY